MDELTEKEPVKSRIKSYFETKSIKEHFKENAKVYLAFGIGIAATLVAVNRDSIRVLVIGHDNTVITILQRRGHPGYIVRCKETGVTLPSLNQMAKLADVNPGTMSRCVNGLIDNINGLHYEILGEAK